MDVLPQDKKLNRRDAFFSLVLQPLEYMTKSLRMGDEWELDDLRPFVNRCRAVVDAYDARMERIGGDK